MPNGTSGGDRGGRLPAEPLLLAVGGQVASGKSTLARALAERLRCAHVEADRVRDELMAEGGGQAVHEAHWGRVHAPGFAEQVYAELLRRGEAELVRCRAVVIDGCFARAHQRLEARALALRHEAVFLFVEAQAGPAAVAARLEERNRTAVWPGWQAIHDDLAEHWEPVVELAVPEHLVVRGDEPVASAVGSVEAHLAGRPEPPRPSPVLRTARLAPAPSVVTFDCWNTLLVEADWETAHALRVAELREAAREAGRLVSTEDAGRAFDIGWQRHIDLWQEGQASGAREVAAWGLAALGLEEPHPALEHLVMAFEEASHSGRVEALDGAPDTLAELARAGVPCALVCDTGLTPGRVVRRHLERLGMLDALAVQVFSDEVGVPKPDPRAFRCALEPLGIAPERALHVGDLRRTDVAGARGVGMQTVRIRHPHDDATELPEADFVVGSHAELQRLLGVDGAVAAS